MTIRENTGKDNKGYQERNICHTFLDAYSAEFVHLYQALTKNSTVTEKQSLDRTNWADSGEMCSPTDSMHDLDVFDMIMKHLN